MTDKHILPTASPGSLFMVCTIAIPCLNKRQMLMRDSALWCPFILTSSYKWCHDSIWLSSLRSLYVFSLFFKTIKEFYNSTLALSWCYLKVIVGKFQIVFAKYKDSRVQQKLPPFIRWITKHRRYSNWIRFLKLRAHSDRFYLPL